MSMKQLLNIILPVSWRNVSVRLRFPDQFLLVLMVSVLAAGSSTAAEQPNQSQDVKSTQVSVSQAVTVNEDAIVVKIVFENRSATPVFIKEGLFGIALRGLLKKVYDLAEPEFFIYKSGQALDYTGPIVLQGPIVRSDFIEFGPGEKSVRQVNVRKGFKFLPGRHEYEIVHRHLELDLATSVFNEKRSEPVKFELDLP